MTVFEMAKLYYPNQWDIKRLDALFAAGKLTQEEYDAVVNTELIGMLNARKENT